MKSKKGISLYNLVRGLSKSEKRYIRLFAEFSSGKKSSRPLELLDILVEMPDYSPEALDARIKGTSLEKHLPSLQNRLLELILKALRNMNTKGGTHWELTRLLLDLDLLFERKMYGECRRRLKKGMQRAEKTRNDLAALQLKEWEWKLDLAQGNAIDQVEEREMEQRLENFIRSYQASFFLAHSRSVLRRQQRGKSTLLQKPDWFSEANSLPQPDHFSAWSDSERAHANWDYLQGNPHEAFRRLKAVLGAWKDRPHEIEEAPATFLNILNNTMNTALYAGIHDEFLVSILTEIRAFPFQHPGLQFTLERITYNLQLSYTLNFLPPQAGQVLIREIETWLAGAGKELPPAKQLSFFYSITMFFFIEESFPQANKWLLRILHLPGQSERKDIRDFAKIFQTVLQYELGNLDLQAYLVRSAYRSFRRANRLYPYEKVLISSMQKLGNATPDSEASRAILQEMRDQLVAIGDQGDRLYPLGVPELILWTESRLEGIPIRESLRKNREASEG